MLEQSVDILIIGGGLAGATLLLALADSGYSTLLVETNPFSDQVIANFDARSLALSPASVRILQMLAIWPRIAPYATAINHIYVSQQARFGQTHLQSDNELPLGYVIEMQEISRVLHGLLDLKTIKAPAKLINLDDSRQLATIECEEGSQLWRAKLIVAADGANSTIRRLLGSKVNTKNYEQHALITNIGLARPHVNQAFERFTKSGPLALLPLSNQRMALIWALSPADAMRLQAISEKDFLKMLQEAFGYKLGRFIKVGQRFIYPLQESIMPVQTAWPCLFIGNAAHTLHPVAGQGFNLGLRDVAALAQCINQYGLQASMLDHYQAMRAYDQKSIRYFTDGLIKLFTSQLPGLGIARSLGLIAMDNSPFLQQQLMRHARGYAGVLPDLVCGIPLKAKETS